MRLRNRVAVVTGGACGIGRAIAELFAREGAFVKVADLAADPPTDVTRDEDVARLVERLDTIDVLVNSAGVLVRGDAVTLSEADWQRALDIDLKSAWLCARHAIPRMRSGGAIVNVASTHPMRTQPGYFPYTVAKGGMLAMTVSMAVDFGPRGIRVNAVCPGLIETPLSSEVLRNLRSEPEKYERVLAAHPLGKIGRPEDVAYAALFLASDESAFITGTSIVVDGGRGARAYTGTT